MTSIAIGADENGLGLKATLIEHLRARGEEVEDYGTEPAEAEDYPDVAERVARAVAAGRHDRAILICGTGIGMAIAANKVHGVRAASVTDPYSAERARKSNDAQILCLGAQIVGGSLAEVLLDHWLESEFAGGRSARKVDKLVDLDDRERAVP
jgi:ribose 5-phosphate isomerase B